MCGNERDGFYGGLGLGSPALGGRVVRPRVSQFIAQHRHTVGGATRRAPAAVQRRGGRQTTPDVGRTQ